MKRTRITTYAATLAVLAVTAAACGSDESSSPSTDAAVQDTAASATEPVTTEPAPVTTEAEPVTAAVDCSDPEQVPVGLQTGSITSSGVEYDYQWTVPSSYDGTPLPVVLDFHGLGSNGEEQAEFVGWPELAETEGFIAVQPSGPPLSISIPRGWEVPQFDTDADNDRNDVGMVVDLLDHLAANVCVDTARIYSTGFSMGAMFTSTLVCELGDVIAAAVTVAGLNHHDQCEPARPVPFLAFHGTDDNVTPIDGKKTGRAGSPERLFFEFEQIMRDELGQFADDFGCTDNEDFSVSESVTLTSYLGCDDDVEVGFYTIEGGGHTWPGSARSAETPGIGVTTMEIDASAIAWDFFERHSLPDTTTTTTATSDQRVYDFSEASELVDAYVAEQGLNGAALVVVERDDGVVHEEYFGDFDADRVSLIASAGKVITAGVLMSLDDEGTLDVDAPVADVVGWGASHPAITPVQLLSNSSGLVGLFDGFAYESHSCWFVPEGALQDCAAQVFEATDDDAAVVAPDTEFRYGGAQWTVAGAVAEVAAGRTWTRLVEETIAGPCGLESIGFNNLLDVNHPAGYDGDPGVLGVTDNPSPGAGAYSNASDYAQLMLMQLRGGMCGDEQVLSSEAVERMLGDRISEVYGGNTAGETTGPDENGYGLGWWVEREAGRRIAFGGFGTTPMLDPDNGFGVYIVTESNGEIGRGVALPLYDLVEAAVLAAR